MSVEIVTYQAAGGVVISDGKMLLLDRPLRGEVRLPKGHVEPGESPRNTALREVSEEAGYADLEIVADLGTVMNHFFVPDRAREVRREEIFFLMRLRSEEPFVRDAHDAGQFWALWVPLDQAPARLTFESEQEFARRAIQAWAGLGKPDEA
jgi:8-oxo-dGTP pyrophosphatase MutT (NUDIX family)